jgi:hypothetical protein
VDWLNLLIRVVVIVVVASVARWIIGSAPEKVINADFKPILGWGILVVAIVLILIVVVRFFGVG